MMVAWWADMIGRTVAELVLFHVSGLIPKGEAQNTQAASICSRLITWDLDVSDGFEVRTK
jgi:hypothetical protein